MKQKKRDRILKAFVFGHVIYASDTNESLSAMIQITNLSVIYKIISGELRGLSPAFIIRKWECSICHGDLEECPHKIEERYGDVECQPIAKDLEPIETSIVKVPQDPRCRVTDLLLIKEKNHERNYEWYGFKVDAEIERFRNIQRALEDNLIPEEAAFRYGKFFSINLVGNTFFP